MILNIGCPYPNSLHEKDGSILFLVKGAREKKLVVVGEGSEIFRNWKAVEVQLTVSG